MTKEKKGMAIGVRDNDYIVSMKLALKWEGLKCKKFK